MVECAALLLVGVFTDQPVRQWLLSIPIPLRFLFANRPSVMGGVLSLIYHCLSSWVIKQAGLVCQAVQTGPVTLIQFFSGALQSRQGDFEEPQAGPEGGYGRMPGINLNLHYKLFLDGAYT